ncbi:hypothetical protein ASPTUDRAFT_234648 [Aspergillus tubingensis CBS 134.48]|uniref:Uncharacterized protein n=1 Tax=Aspergillus tubingensis (strain CBS 134.48) TaxID=767770 RepID=A0A1L9NMJ9_ASPTC|nr:hypothetical protein ASPTUDRAFT_234648 [Aspergillus tubingensis CBS 134.48]
MAQSLLGSSRQSSPTPCHLCTYQDHKKSRPREGVLLVVLNQPLLLFKPYSYPLPSPHSTHYANPCKSNPRTNQKHSKSASIDLNSYQNITLFCLLIVLGFPLMILARELLLVSWSLHWPLPQA